MTSFRRDDLEVLADHLITRIREIDDAQSIVRSWIAVVCPNGEVETFGSVADAMAFVRAERQAPPPAWGPHP